MIMVHMPYSELRWLTLHIQATSPDIASGVTGHGQLNREGKQGRLRLMLNRPNYVFSFHSLITSKAILQCSNLPNKTAAYPREESSPVLNNGSKSILLSISLNQQSTSGTH